ncbi:hypothetical protein [Enterococcus cecorum]|uniref:hypothetical protein n=1 Tax=Enterococcus cecorum TaxID=44008 RepID=UPI000B3810D9|nr:hypothetical protein [Enterococcus cecorum]OUN46873.1 hypothetical protein B5G19_09780 [Enterococcus cecorum]
MKRMITYLIFVALSATVIIKFTHFNWVLPTIIVAILGLIVLGLLKVNDKLNEIQNKNYQNHNIYLDEDFDDCSDLMDIEVPEPKEIEYYKDTKTPLAIWESWYRDNPFKDLSKHLNVEGGSNMFYLVTYGGAKFSIYYDPDFDQHVINGISQNSDLSSFAKAEMSYGDAFIRYDEDTNTLHVF